MAEKLFKDFAPSHGIPMQKDIAPRSWRWRRRLRRRTELWVSR